MSTDDDIGEALLDTQELPRRLEEVCRFQRQENGPVTVGVFRGRANAFATIERGVKARRGLEAASTLTFAGCVTKALTTTLVSQTISHRKLSLDDPVAKVLPEFGATLTLGRVTVRQLLNHTHGLDMSSVQEVPREGSGYIDAKSLVEHVKRHGHLHGPGEIYSYGNGGMWCAAAIVERLEGRRFDVLVAEHLLEPIGIHPRRHPDYDIAFCPSLGGGLTLTVCELMKFLQWNVLSEESDAARCITRGVVPGEPWPMPGWAMERGYCLGWKYYGGGWFGHNMVFDLASLVVRFSIRQRAGVVVVAPGPSAGMVFARLFADKMVEFRERQIPRPHRDAKADLRVSGIAGCYQNELTRAMIRYTERGACVEFFDRADSVRRSLISSLSPCTYGAFMTEPSASAHGIWLQFIHPSCGGFRYLWNGKDVLRRCE